MKVVKDTRVRGFLPFHDRGFLPAYHMGEANRCPGCGRSHWFIGRVTAECGFCTTALPLREALYA